MTDCTTTLKIAESLCETTDMPVDVFLATVAGNIEQAHLADPTGLKGAILATEASLSTWFQEATALFNTLSLFKATGGLRVVQ